MIVAILQARMGSNRLPGKVLMQVNNHKPVIQYVVEQLQNSKKIEKIIVATTIEKEDDNICNFVSDKLKIDYFRGSQADVLDRYYQCAKKYLASIIVRITCDDPLIDPEIVDSVINKFEENTCDVSTNAYPRSFPQGTEVEVFSFEALEKVWKETKLPSEREHVTPYFYKNPQIFKIKNLMNKKDISNLRWTVDRKEDLELVKIIASTIKKRPILLEDILKILKKRPELVKINEGHHASEGYIKSLQEDKEFLQDKSLNTNQ